MTDEPEDERVGAAEGVTVAEVETTNEVVTVPLLIDEIDVVAVDEPDFVTSLTDGDIDTDTVKDPPFAAAPEVIDTAIVPEAVCMPELVKPAVLDAAVDRDAARDEVTRPDPVADASAEADGLPLTTPESVITAVDEILSRAERDADDDGVSEREGSEERDARGLPVLDDVIVAEDVKEASPVARPDADGDAESVGAIVSFDDRVELDVIDEEEDALCEVLGEALLPLELLEDGGVDPLALTDGEVDTEADDFEDRDDDVDIEPLCVYDMRGLTVVVPEVDNVRATDAERIGVDDVELVSVPPSAEEEAPDDREREAEMLPVDESEPTGTIVLDD
jgi:hypothetical protein